MGRERENALNRKRERENKISKVRFRADARMSSDNIAGRRMT